MPNTYSAKQVAKMVINPYSAGNILEAYPFLREMIPEDTFGVDLNKFFRFLAFVYDPNSPLIKQFTNIEPRKKAAAAEVLFKLDHENELRHISIAFLRHLKSPVWAEICVNENLFWDYAKILSTPMDGEGEDLLKAVERQGKMTDQMGKFRSRSAELWKEFTGGDEQLAEVEVVDYRPEGMNRAIRKAAK